MMTLKPNRLQRHLSTRSVQQHPASVFSTRSLFLCVLVLLCTSNAIAGTRVAVIGGGISGTFFSKYLVDFDESCLLDEVVIFDPNPLGEPTLSDTDSTSNLQGSRVASTALDDGSVVELGASVFYDGFELVMEMIRSDETLRIGEAFNTGNSPVLHPDLRKGLGIYNGNGDWRLLTTWGPKWYSTLKLLWRYNVDLLTAFSAANRVEASFRVLHEMLDSAHIGTFFQHPNEMWDAVKLLPPATATFADFLDRLGVSRELSWWRKYLPYQGILRDELLAAINLCNYNQGIEAVNGECPSK